MNKLSFVLALFIYLLSLTPSRAQDVTINIVGAGSSASYVEEGQATQKAVEGRVGQTVRWVNNGNRIHTATAFTDSDEVIFDTLEIAPGTAVDVMMTPDVFEVAGGSAGHAVVLDYICDFHSQMSSQLILTDSALAPLDGLTANRVVRRDITTLSPAELTAYRDAWREIQSNGSFAALAGFHGCPQNFCHRDRNTFLAWHREYILRLEAALQAVDSTVALHYWDWTAPQASIDGLPEAFTARTYISNGSVVRNPLRSSAFRCDGQSRFTNRFTQQPFQLAAFAQRVENSYLMPTFVDFDSAIDGPHGSIHVWIRGDMMSPTFAAYDPIFWAHHSNVDRQWASWQQAGRPAPDPIVSTLSLRGFSGKSVGDVVDFESLGYVYDRYDQLFGTQALEVAGARAKSKTFSIDLKAVATTETVSVGGLDLVVSGIPTHPTESMMVHVFVNKPDATLADVGQNQPGYAGSFGIFGHAIPGMVNMEAMDDAVPRGVLDLSSYVQPSLETIDETDAKLEITLIAEDKDGNAIPFNRVPVTAVQVGN